MKTDWFVKFALSAVVIAIMFLIGQRFHADHVEAQVHSGPTSPVPVDGMTQCMEYNFREIGRIQYAQADAYAGETLTEVPKGGASVHVCSFEINNGPNAQDVAIYALPKAISHLGHAVCGQTSSSIITVYHLGPYEHIARGSGIGQIYSLPVGQALRFQKYNNDTSAVEFGLTYAIF